MKAHINLVTRILLMAVFLYAGTTKLFGGQHFIQEMMRSQLLPVPMIYVFRWLIPFLELLIGIALLQESTKIMGIQAAFFLMTSFTFYLIALIVVFVYPPCACGGILGGLSYPAHIAFNIAFTLIALLGIYTHEEKPTA